jgi:hypothetical protein
MKELLNGNGDSIKSHIFEAVAIAAADEVCRVEIVKRVIPERDDYICTIPLI